MHALGYNVPRGIGGYMRRITTTAASAIQAMISATGAKKAAIDKRAGFKGQMVSQYTTKNTVPGIDVLARIANACGMRLQMTGGDDVVVIDPPE